MKTCTKCKQQLNTTNFSKQTKSKDGLHHWCKSCFAQYEKVRYKNGDRQRKERNNKARRDRNRKFIKNYLETHPCIDCGDSDWWALDFDHKEQTDKTKELTYFISENGIESIKKEIEKCDVRCVKCHRKRTIIQLNWWRGNNFIVDDV